MGVEVRHDATSLLVIHVDGRHYALPLAQVNRVVRAVEVTPLPTAPEAFAGVIDVGGDILPVVDLRLRLGIDRRPVGVDDCMVIAQTSFARLVLPVDGVLGIAGDLVAPTDTDSEPLHPDCIDRVMRDADGLVMGIDLDRLITTRDYAALSQPVGEVGGS